MQTSSQKSSTNAGNSTGISSDKPANQKTQSTSKIMITGDDILIEYVARLVKCISNLNQPDVLISNQLSSMEKFVTHYVWKQPD